LLFWVSEFFLSPFYNFLVCVFETKTVYNLYDYVKVVYKPKRHELVNILSYRLFINKSLRKSQIPRHISSFAWHSYQINEFVLLFLTHISEL